MVKNAHAKTNKGIKALIAAPEECSRSLLRPIVRHSI